jgi:hypothetical protein
LAFCTERQMDVAIKIDEGCDGRQRVDACNVESVRAEHSAAYLAGDAVIRMVAYYQGAGPAVDTASGVWRWESPKQAHGAVYELAAGGSLQSRLYRLGECGDPTVVRILTALERLTIVEAQADCLVSLHAMGIIHGDVKDDNVLLRRREDLSSVRLTDLRLWTPIGSRTAWAASSTPPATLPQSSWVLVPSTDVGQLGILHLELATSPHRNFRNGTVAAMAASGCKIEKPLDLAADVLPAELLLLSSILCTRTEDRPNGRGVRDEAWSIIATLKLKGLPPCGPEFNAFNADTLVGEQLAKIVQALLLARPLGKKRCSVGGGGSYDGRDERGSSGDAEDVDSHISSISHTMPAAHRDTFGGMALIVRPPSYAGQVAVSSQGSHDAITGAGAKPEIATG